MSVRDELIRNITSQVNVNIEEVAGVFGVILLIFIMIDWKHNLASFRLLAIAAVVSDFMDLIATYVTFTIDENLFFAHFLVVLLNTLNYSGFGFIAYTLFRYLKAYVRPTRLMHSMTNAVDMIFAVYIMFLGLSVICPRHFIIDYDFITQKFVRTSMSYIIGYGLPLSLVTVTILLLVLYNKEFSNKQKRTIFLGYLLCVVGCVIQMLADARVLVAHGMGVLAVVVLYFSLESPDYKRMAGLLRESREAQDRIKEAQRAREDLFAGMTHEIRTPLNAVLGINQLIEACDKDPTVQVLTRKIKREGESVLTVVTQILNQAKTEDEERHAETGIPQLTDKYILSIDDTPINLKIIEGLLSQTGASITSVRSGKEGLEEMEKAHFDLVVIDHQMPGMDGMATMKRMQESDLKVDTPVIMVTGNDGEEYRKMYREAGFDGYVKKPVKREELFSVINSLIGRGEKS